MFVARFVVVLIKDIAQRMDGLFLFEERFKIASAVQDANDRDSRRGFLRERLVKNKIVFKSLDAPGANIGQAESLEIPHSSEARCRSEIGEGLFNGIQKSHCRCDVVSRDEGGNLIEVKLDSGPEFDDWLAHD